MACHNPDDLAGHSLHVYYRRDWLLPGLHPGLGDQWWNRRPRLFVDVLCVVSLPECLPPLPHGYGCRAGLAALYRHPWPDDPLLMGLEALCVLRDGRWRSRLASCIQTERGYFDGTNNSRAAQARSLRQIRLARP